MLRLTISARSSSEGFRGLNCLWTLSMVPLTIQALSKLLLKPISLSSSKCNPQNITIILVVALQRPPRTQSQSLILRWLVVPCVHLDKQSHSLWRRCRFLPINLSYPETPPNNKSLQRGMGTPWRLHEQNLLKTFTHGLLQKVYPVKSLLRRVRSKRNLTG